MIRSETGRREDPDWTHLLICCRDLPAELIWQRCFIQVVETANLEARITIKFRESLHTHAEYYSCELAKSVKDIHVLGIRRQMHRNGSALT